MAQKIAKEKKKVWKTKSQLQGLFLHDWNSMTAFQQFVKAGRRVQKDVFHNITV